MLLPSAKFRTKLCRDKRDMKFSVLDLCVSALFALTET